jgi:probable rRNA maturation factor
MAASAMPARSAIEIDLVEDDGDWSALADAEALVMRAAVAVGEAASGAVRSGLVTVALSSDAHVADLNAQFRGKAKPTNVLSFPPGGGVRGEFLGDIVMSQETVAREASELGIPLAHHVQHLVVHGILHLLGYDHVASDDAERMEAIEIEILSSLGIANPYTGALETGRTE